MASFMRNALNGVDAPNDTKIIMAGPLSEQFTKALNIAFAKNDEITDEPQTERSLDVKNEVLEKKLRAVSQESQQLEDDLQRKVLATGVLKTNKPENTLTVYSVDAGDVRDEDIVAFAKMASAASTPTEMALIAPVITQPIREYNNEKINAIFNKAGAEKVATIKAEALKTIAASFGIRTFTSIEEFQEALMG